MNKIGPRLWMFLKFPRQTFTKPRMVCLAEAILEVHCIRSMLLPPSPSRASPLLPCMGLRAHILGHRPGAPGSPSHFLSLVSQTCSPLLSPRAGTVCFHLFERIHFWIPQWPTGSLCWVHTSTSCSAGMCHCPWDGTACLQPGAGFCRKILDPILSFHKYCAPAGKAWLSTEASADAWRCELMLFLHVPDGSLYTITTRGMTAQALAHSKAF